MNRHVKRVNGWRLVVFAGLTALLLISVFWWRAAQTSSSDAQLCRKIDRLDSALFVFVSSQKPPQPGDYGYTYWQAFHRLEPNGAPGKPPPTLLALLRSAACDPSNLPSQGGNP